MTKNKDKNLDGLPVHTCPYVDWYKFKKCEITTCKNHSRITPSQCLGIDRVSTTGAKFISDSEIHLFKFKGEKITTRLVSMRRKKAIERVKSLLVLREYLNFIREKYESQGENSPVVLGKYAQRFQNTYPLKIKKLRFKNWMWHYVVDGTVHEEFIEKQNGGECKDIKIEQLLQITQLKYLKLLKEIEASKHE